MKKMFFLLPFVAVFLIFMSSCQRTEKVDAIVKQTVDATLKVNESYTFTLPASTSDDAFKITSQAQSFVVSEIGLDDTGTNRVYKYTPLRNFVGTDQVVIATTEEEHGGTCQGSHGGDSTHVEHHQGGNPFHHNHHHHHHHHHTEEAETQTEITINLTIVGDVLK